MSEEELKQVAIHSGVLEVGTDFLEDEFRAECERVLPYPGKWNHVNAEMHFCI